MHSITQTQRYLPHELTTRYHAVRLYRAGYPVSFVCRRYKISKASLMRWNRAFDGNQRSLKDKSHRPLSPHPNAHTELEIRWIRNQLRRTPHISVAELYGKLRTNKGYQRHPGSLFRLLRRLGYYDHKKTRPKPYKPKPYHTPTTLGIKWQMDVKFVPTRCYAGAVPQKFYQYTVIDEASRERFVYPYQEISSYSSMDFLKRALVYFRYTPQTIQTDNGAEFTHLAVTDRVHGFDRLCRSLGIRHTLIRPRTPRHNGKVERSHRSDNERFYRHLRFYSYDDLRTQMKRYLTRSNNIPMQVLDWLSPLEKRQRLSHAEPLLLRQ